MVLLCSGRALQSTIFTAYSGIMPFVAKEWDMSATTASSIQSAWHLAYLVSLFGSGFLSDRYGARRVFLVAAILSSMATTVFAALAQDHLSALVLYALVALLAGGTYTPGLALVHQHSPSAVRGRNMGFFLAAASVGYALGLLLIGLTINVAGWRAGLSAIAVSCVLGTLLCIRALRKLPSAPPAKPAGGGWFGAMRETLSDRNAMTLNWAYMFHCWELFALWAWMPAFLVFLAGSNAAIGASAALLLASVAHLSSAAGSVAGGALSDRFGRAPTIAVIGGIGAVTSFLAGATVYLPFLLVCLFFCVYNLLAIADSPVYSTAMAETVPTERLGIAFSVRSVMGFGAGAISPLVFGGILDSTQLSARFGTHGTWAFAWMSLGLVTLWIPLVMHKAARRPR
ncbi:MFS transporter [Herbaspirillum sp. HC18]|nr:MFS transporter [Herbaspirillum sp. HC18]